MSSYNPDRAPTIAIAGSGFSGTLLAIRLAELCDPAVRIQLIEGQPRFGVGLAYATSDPDHLLNVPAGKLSAFSDRPDHFLDWLRHHHGRYGPEVLVPRRWYGDYLRELLGQAVVDSGGRIALIQGSAIALQQRHGRVIITLDNDRPLLADQLVLATGHPPPQPPTDAHQWFYDSDFYRADPWNADALDDLDPDAPVLLIGTGLTMADIVLSLLNRGHRGTIHALSRRGLLPQMQGSCESRPDTLPARLPTSLTTLSRTVRDACRATTAAGGDWRTVLNALRPRLQDLWQSLPTTEQARFLRHLRPWWDSHRHRLPPATWWRLQDAMDHGQLRIHAGRIMDYRRQASNIAVDYRLRGAAGRVTLTAERVLNCAGPGCDYTRIRHPLLRQLLDQGLIRPDPLRLGLDVDGAGRLLDRCSRPSAWLSAVGPVTRGAFWEITAVPEIRRQCEQLAERLARTASPHPSTFEFTHYRRALESAIFHTHL